MFDLWLITEIEFKIPSHKCRLFFFKFNTENFCVCICRQQLNKSTKVNSIYITDFKTLKRWHCWNRLIIMNHIHILWIIMIVSDDQRSKKKLWIYVKNKPKYTHVFKLVYNNNKHWKLIIWWCMYVWMYVFCTCRLKSESECQQTFCYLAVFRLLLIFFILNGNSSNTHNTKNTFLNETELKGTHKFRNVAIIIARMCLVCVSGLIVNFHFSEFF